MTSPESGSAVHPKPRGTEAKRRLLNLVRLINQNLSLAQFYIVDLASEDVTPIYAIDFQEILVFADPFRSVRRYLTADFTEVTPKTWIEEIDERVAAHVISNLQTDVVLLEGTWAELAYFINRLVSQARRAKRAVRAGAPTSSAIKEWASALTDPQPRFSSLTPLDKSELIEALQLLLHLGLFSERLQTFLNLERHKHLNEIVSAAAKAEAFDETRYEEVLGQLAARPHRRERELNNRADAYNATRLLGLNRYYQARATKGDPKGQNLNFYLLSHTIALFTALGPGVTGSIAYADRPIIHRPSAVFHMALILEEYQNPLARSQPVADARRTASDLEATLEGIDPRAFDRLMSVHLDAILDDAQPLDELLVDPLAKQWRAFVQDPIIARFFTQLRALSSAPPKTRASDPLHAIRSLEEFLLPRLERLAVRAIDNVTHRHLLEALRRQLEPAAYLRPAARQDEPIWRQVLLDQKVDALPFENTELGISEFVLRNQESGLDVLRVQYDMQTRFMTIAWPTPIDVISFCEILLSFLRQGADDPVTLRVISLSHSKKTIRDRVLTIEPPRKARRQLAQPSRHPRLLSQSEAKDLAYLRVCGPDADYCYQPSPLDRRTPANVAIVSDRHTKATLRHFWVATSLERFLPLGQLIPGAVFPASSLLSQLPEA